MLTNKFDRLEFDQSWRMIFSSSLNFFFISS